MTRPVATGLALQRAPDHNLNTNPNPDLNPNQTLALSCSAFCKLTVWYLKKYIGLDFFATTTTELKPENMAVSPSPDSLRFHNTFQTSQAQCEAKFAVQLASYCLILTKAPLCWSTFICSPLWMCTFTSVYLYDLICYRQYLHRSGSRPKFKMQYFPRHTFPGTFAWLFPHFF